MGSVAGAVYILSIGAFVEKFPPLVSYSMIVISSATTILILGPLFITGITFDFNPQTGVFGFFTNGDYIYTLFAVGLVAGAMTYAGFGYVIKLFSPMVLCTGFLFEPVVAQIVGCAMGLDKLPGL